MTFASGQFDELAPQHTQVDTCNKLNNCLVPIHSLVGIEGAKSIK